MSSLSPLTDEECARCRLEGMALESGFLLEDGGELRWLQPPQAHGAPAMKVVVGFASVVLVLGGVLPFSEGWLFEASPGGAGLSAQWWACGLGLLAWWSLGTLLIRRMWPLGPGWTVGRPTPRDFSSPVTPPPLTKPMECPPAAPHCSRRCAPPAAVSKQPLES